MEGKLLYVMAQYDEETEAKFNKIQKALYDAGFVGTQTPNFPKHITLGSFDLDKESELIDKVKEICSNTKKIKMSFDSMGLFGMEVLFIAPTVTHELLDLQENFNYNHQNNYNWVAHTTLLVDNPEVIQKSLPIVAQNFSSFSGYIESISLYEFSPSRFILEEKLL
ncbi:2'-5' RNA ligase [Romboutsia weinsteinii]|uniref:2'-5' RNA ligase n=1 Tax=Romboutsia weinsteinii TaxID=2020949 RepID=A0A371J3G3_9FIRM|nr:2'-5' RNA ligase family protein [Romboutsia weinsteinii]RDY27321.1 2'-5' RNA ligase [Romboutsia weinsteinii]